MLEHLRGVVVLHDLPQPHVPDHVEEPVPHYQFSLADEGGVIGKVLRGTSDGSPVRSVLLQVFVNEEVLPKLCDHVYVFEDRRVHINQELVGGVEAHLDILDLARVLVQLEEQLVARGLRLHDHRVLPLALAGDSSRK